MEVQLHNFLRLRISATKDCLVWPRNFQLRWVRDESPGSSQHDESSYRNYGFYWFSGVQGVSQIALTFPNACAYMNEWISFKHNVVGLHGPPLPLTAMPNQFCMLIPETSKGVRILLSASGIVRGAVD